MKKNLKTTFNFAVTVLPANFASIVLNQFVLDKLLKAMVTLALVNFTYTVICPSILIFKAKFWII